MGEVIHVVQLKFKPEVDSGKIEEVRPLLALPPSTQSLMSADLSFFKSIEDQMRPPRHQEELHQVHPTWAG
jgi:predicted component of type VI protein secretion system